MTARSAMIVDDESLARERVRSFLQPFSEIEITGTYGDPIAALDAIAADRPDVLFLDVQMSPLDGFDLLMALEKEQRPAAIIFVTAHDRYALRAFDVNAIDYLLKPFTKERFNESVERALKRLADAQGSRLEIERLLQTLQKETRIEERFAAWHRGGFHLVRAAEVDWFEADRNYVLLHVGPIAYAVRSTLNAIEQRLDDDRFVRVHRSSIVNLERLRRIEPWFHGEYVAFLTDGTRLRVSRTYGARLRRFLSSRA